MQRGVQREDKAEGQQPQNQRGGEPRRGAGRDPGGQCQRGGDRHQPSGEPHGLRGEGGFWLALGAEKARRKVERLARDIAFPGIWAYAFVGGEVSWRGNAMKIRTDGANKLNDARRCMRDFRSAHKELRECLGRHTFEGWVDA